MSFITYGRFAESILTTFYKGQRSDDAAYSLKHVAELVCQEQAFVATKNAFTNSNAGEVSFVNDSFITTYKNLPVLTNAVDKSKYVALPSMPAALPNNLEIQRVWPVGQNKKEIIPMKNNAKFSQSLLPAIQCFILYYIEDQNLIFDNPSAFSLSAVNINMVGAMPAGDALLDAILVVPSNYQTEIFDRVIARLNNERRYKSDDVNDAIDESN